jgi:hypothetical protein
MASSSNPFPAAEQLMPQPAVQTLTPEQFQQVLKEHGTLNHTAIAYLDSILKRRNLECVLLYINTLELRRDITHSHALYLTNKMKTKKEKNPTTNGPAPHWILKLMDMSEEDLKKDKEVANYHIRKRYEGDDKEIDNLEQHLKRRKRWRAEREQKVEKVLKVYDLVDNTPAVNDNAPVPAPLANQ